MLRAINPFSHLPNLPSLNQWRNHLNTVYNKTSAAAAILNPRSYLSAETITAVCLTAPLVALAIQDPSTAAPLFNTAGVTVLTISGIATAGLAIKATTHIANRAVTELVMLPINIFSALVVAPVAIAATSSAVVASAAIASAAVVTSAAMTSTALVTAAVIAPPFIVIDSIIGSMIAIAKKIALFSPPIIFLVCLSVAQSMVTVVMTTAIALIALRIAFPSELREGLQL